MGAAGDANGAPDAAAGAGGVDAVGDVAMDGPSDAGVEVAPSPAVVVDTFNKTREDVERARFIECFGAGEGPLSTWRFANDVVLDYDLSVGLVKIDQAAFDKCLETARTASCAAVAAGAIEAACDHVLAGQVPVGGFCLNDEDCVGLGHACNHNRTKCEARCGGRPGAGPGTGTEGAPCTGADGCAPGFSCANNGPRTMDGLCHARAAGGSCDGQWACPFPFTCVFDAAGKGTCGTGKRAGDPCKLYGFDAFNGPYDECTISLGCYPDALGDFHCGEGVGTGVQCGGLPPPKPDQNGGFIPCRTDLCDPDSSPRRCVPYRKEGESCTVYYQCADNLDCWKGTCRRPGTTGLAVGQPCGGVDLNSQCAPGAFCDIDINDPNPAAQGVCRAWIADGKACDFDYECGPLSGCASGTCAPCK
jgi:hypothetical protein